MIDPQEIFDITTEQEFNRLSHAIFRHQFEHNAVYRSFCDLINVNPSDVIEIKDIPFLPIQFFKTHAILSTSQNVVKTFESSGTTGAETSKHYITDLSIYEQSFIKGFEHFYGSISNYTILALLPSYLERDNSSLIYMVDRLIRDSGHEKSGFYLNNLDSLTKTLIELESQQQKTLLIGVSFALLDLIESHQFKLQNTIVMETGGMKGRRKELIREELHNQLKIGFGIDQIHSEYGMTELLSQAYSKQNGVFETPPWMNVLIRDTEDELSILNHTKTGGINIIDLANINSCSFIATQDLGLKIDSERFEILGRFDHSDIRGCNLMVI